MKSHFLKNCFFAITALITVSVNILKGGTINSGDHVFLRPTSHSQGYTLTGHYEEIRTSFEPEKWEANGVHWCGLKRGSYKWCITNTDTQGGQLCYGAAVNLKSEYYATEEIAWDKRTHIGGYLCAEPEDKGYSVHANREKADKWEVWKLINPNNPDDTSPIPNKGKVALKSLWDRYLCGKPDQTIIADRMEIKEWETWIIEKEE